MGKSSSSLKKKRSKKSSKVRSRKISKTSSRKSKSKKLRRREDSSSYSSSEDDSRSLFSVSSYSSEDDYRSRRARSRTRKDVKSGKKRSRKRSSSRDSGEDSRRVKKKKDDGSRGRKRIPQKMKKKKKKGKRDASVSSMSSGSRSCSSCWSDYGRSDESEYDRQKESEERNIDKIKTERYRSMDDPALYGQHTESSDHWIEEKVRGENYSRRLRSVITVIKQGNEETELDNEEHKEEIVYDHDDYPSCRSNDSNDGGSKKESGYTSTFDSERKVQVETEKEGPVISNNRTLKLETDKDGNNPYCEVPVATRDPDGEDLESVLRQRALENLKKFRGKDLGDNSRKHALAAKVESVENKPTEENGGRVASSTEIVEHISMPLSKRDNARSLRSDEKTLYQNDGGNQSGPVSESGMQDITCPPNHPTVADNPQRKVTAAASPVTVKPKLVAAAVRQNSSKPQTTVKQASASPKTSHENPVTGSSIEKSSPRDAQAIALSSGKDDEGVNHNVSGSAILEPPPSLKSPPEAIISNEPQDESKESSQYEQKTMSVMRGGEMVQVSYKVYIPKKAPALARRQLKR